MPRFAAIPLVVSLTAQAIAAPSGTNLSFENSLNGWTSDKVAVESGFSFEGSHRLDLEDGFVEQTITGLTPGLSHTLQLAYLSQSGQSFILSSARVLIDGQTLGELHTSQSNEYLSCNGFGFIPAATTATLRIESLESTNPGMLIDDIRIALDNLPTPPSESWSNLTTLSDARGGRQLVNGSFESTLGNPATDPDNSGPVGNEHLCGYALPGWLVTRENVDVIQFSTANPPQGTNALDTNGHGPGGIAQTITGLTPGGAYTFSFLHARHTSWGSGVMTGEALVNGSRGRSLARTISQTWDDGYELVEIPAIANPSGSLTLEVRSTTTDLGGNIIYDDFRIAEGADLIGEWAEGFGVSSDPAANDDTDHFSNGFDFIFGLDPNTNDPPFLPHVDNNDRILTIPISGTALSQGFAVELMTSRDLSSWLPAADSSSGVTLLSDTSSPGIDGQRRYLIAPTETHLFWTHHLSLP